MDSMKLITTIKFSAKNLPFGFLKNKSMTHGWPYLAAWAHRISGVFLILYAWIHIITMSSLHDPKSFDLKMKIFQNSLFIIFEWLLAIPVIYHSLNGGRIVAYEIFENRKDKIILRWVVCLSTLYLFVLGLFMLIGNQSVSAVFFWVYITMASVCFTYITVVKIKSSGASIFWKFQRISGSFLLLMIPAHMLFMHLNNSIGHDAQTIILRIDNLFIKLVDLFLLLCVIYHGAYGLYTISCDYLQAKIERIGVVVILVGGSLVLAWIGMKLIVLI